MLGSKLLIGCAAIFATGTEFFLAVPPARAADRQISVVAPADLIIYRQVSFSDLNLALPAGQTTLRHRVGGAVHSLCDAVMGNVSMSMPQILRSRCHDDAWGQANPQIASAVQRAQDLAATGTSSITAAAIVISISND